MNIHEIMDQKRWKELLESFQLSPKNIDIGLAYLTGEPADETLLQDVEPVSFKTNLGRNIRILGSSNAHIEKLRKSAPERMERIYKLFWAMGKSTIGMVLDDMSQNRHFDQELDWRIGVLGKAAVAAMELERLALLCVIRRERLDWLYELAEHEPEVLEEAQNLSGMPIGNLKVALAGILLANTADSAVIDRQKKILLTININSLNSLTDQLDENQLADLRAYILAGDLAAPIPGGLPALSAENALQTRNSNEYLTGLLAMTSFQAIAVDDCARCALRLYLRLNPQSVLGSIINLGRTKDLLDHFDELLEDLPGGAATMLLYLASGRHRIANQIRTRLMIRCKGGLEEALKLADNDQYFGIIGMMPYAVPSMADEKQRIITVFQRYVSSGQQELAEYLNGSGSLADSRRELSAVARGQRNPNLASNMLILYRLDHGWDEFMCRCAAVLIITFEGRNMRNVLEDMNREKAAERVAEGDVLYGARFAMEHVDRMMYALIEKKLPFGEVLAIMEDIHEDAYFEELQRKIRVSLSLCAAKPEFIPELCEMMKTGSVFARETAVNALYNLAPDHPEAKAGVLAAAGDSSKQIKEALVTLYAGRPEWVEDYRKLLTAKKAAERLLAVEVLARLNEREALEAALAAEKNAKVADAIREKLGAEAPAAVGTAADIAANIVKGNKIKKLGWLLNEQLHAVRNADGTEADETIRNAILLSYCELGRIGRSETAAELSAGLDRQDMEKLALQVFDIWFAAGAQAKNKWVMPFAAVYGGSTMTERLRKCIHDWPEHQRGAIACDAVMALALSEDPAAIVIVDAISRKFKFRQVKQAAALALENAAQELGITAEELADRIVPDLGFGKDGTRVFDYGKRSFTVRLTPTLELQITNDQGKTVKNLPAPGKTDDPAANDAYEAFKTMKKQIKTTVTAQRARLEAALSVLRCWDTQRWKALFVENPIMHQFAMSLVWGVYADGSLTDTFRYMEDGTFNTVDEDEYELPEQAMIGLVHPMELDSDALDGWKQQLEDYEIVQSIDQLSRPTYALDPGKAGEKRLEDFGGKLLNGLSLSGKLLQQGWYRGSVQDGGVFYTFYREDKGLGIGVELRFSGSAVGYDDGENVTVFDAVFYTGTVNRGSYVYDEVPEEHILTLGSVSARYYSEILHQLTRATASSTETNENWRSEKNV